jgi:predicted secreted Zn-dependent protease
LKWLAYTTSDPREAHSAIRQVIRLDPDDPWTGEAANLFAASAQRNSRRIAGQGCLSGLLMGVLVLAGLLLIGAAGLQLRIPGVEQIAQVTLAAPLGMQPETPAQVEEIASVEYYSFDASTVRDIQNAIYTQGPEVESIGEHSIALTNYELWVTWQMAQSVTSCRVQNVVVHLDITYTYPQWHQPAGADPWLVNEWNRFFKHVVAHEEHHGQIARDCAGELADLLMNFDAGTICSASEDDLDEVVSNLYASCEARQQAFDAREVRTTFPLP